MKSLTFVALILVFISGCGPSSSDDQASFQYASDPSFTKLGSKGTQAMAVFQNACPQFGRFASDFENISVAVKPHLWFAPNAPYGPTGFGWKNIVDISFRVKNNPTNHELIDKTFGSACELSLGAGLMPGVFSKKPACASICGRVEDAEEGGVVGGFFSIPELAVLDESSKQP